MTFFLCAGALAACTHEEPDESQESNASAAPTTPEAAQISGASGNRQVLEFHNSPTRDGLYVDGAFTRAAAAKLHRDTKFSATVSGPTYAQPLYFEGGPGGKDLLIVATERNEVTAFDAANGSIVWRKTLAQPAARASLPCGNISTLGVTGTPVIDKASRTLVVAAMTSTAQHKIFALSLDDGSVKPGWPVTPEGVTANGFTFVSRVQNQRGALTILNDTVYIPYGGHYGDCGNYHGFVLGVPLKNPSATFGWATRAKGGGLWSPGGVASDGTSLFVATGNTMSATGGLFSAPATYGDGESVIRLPPSLKFSGQSADFAAAMNWSALDRSDSDVGGSGPLLFNVASGTPSALAMALGKDGGTYLLNAKSLGGMGGFLGGSKRVATDQIITAPAAYSTPSGTYVAFKGAGICPGGGSGRRITTLKITGGMPPQVSVAWCGGTAGQGSPIVTSTGSNADSIVWYVAAEGDNRLRGFNGETGAVIFNGGGASEAMTGITRFQSPIVAKGRIFVAGNSQVYAFTVDGAGGGSQTTPPPDEPGLSAACRSGYTSFAAPFFNKYCTSCHGATLESAGLRLDMIDRATANPDIVIAVAGSATGARMPPQTSAQPTAAERAQLTTWLESCR